MPADLHPATSADLPVIHGLILETGLSTDPALITATLDGSSYWLATEAGQVVGTVGLEHGDGASLLRSAAVRPAAQGRGVGAALARAAIGAARARGDRATYLFTDTAGPYWARLGFEPVRPADLIRALPDAPQVRGGLARGWIHGAAAWRLDLTGVSP
ncbi:GNAT family N-acetyltransferase [Deinococcus seoulensis]|uniref:GNAT family N-acetyltransferase n=1 Tax=Deinococcus seoulensis TaxID=1837379 RepID=A0ABQ2RU55_9DEIO|nr:GNAT family N-acetyltransferase [Deinococcus seoulensis]GGR64827.1 GNAT family N-acetyltransferase [Deinococcus seoulensis]